VSVPSRKNDRYAPANLSQLEIGDVPDQSNLLEGQRAVFPHHRANIEQRSHGGRLNASVQPRSGKSASRLTLCRP
jgi:hypothetical protein